jgi:arginase
MLKHFDNIIIAECSVGQKKIGVHEGGKYICDELKIVPNITFEKRIFNNINSEYENGYYILSKFLENINQNGKKTLLIGGDHSLGISSVDFLLNKYQDKLRVLWIDAHADINDNLTSLSGNLHGMPLGYHHISRSDIPYWRKQNQFRLDSTQLYYFGIRDLDPAEIKLIKEEHIRYSNKIDEDLIRFIDESEVLLISFDVDALDPNHLDSTGCLAPNGLSPSDVNYIINYSIFHNKLIHLDIMEFNPHLGDVKKSMECLKNILC